MAWKDESAIAAPLVSHGTVTFPTGRKTNANGETSLHFGPKDEKLPGLGSVHYSANAATGVALYQSAFKNVPGSVAQFLTPKSVTFDWSVSFHLARGFKFAGTVAYGFNNDRRLAYDMHVCGDDPFGAPWTGSYTYVGESPGTRQAIWPFVPGLDISPVEGGKSNFQQQGQLSLTKPFTVHLTLASEGQTDQRSLPLEEDRSCPDNTPSGSSP